VVGRARRDRCGDRDNRLQPLVQIAAEARGHAAATSNFLVRLAHGNRSDVKPVFAGVHEWPIDLGLAIAFTSDATAHD